MMEILPKDYNLELIKNITPSMRYKDGEDFAQWQANARARLCELLGFDNMKIVAGLKKADEKAKAVEAIKSGKSPDSVIAMMKKKAKEVDPKEKLEKDRARLTKTINELTQRLEYVEESLASL